ncbi:MAG TPA: tetratricopeptide repeat protein, partial [Chthonomonadaceae bacterium]|nr:tetratricopeptide repeat protein [Chthonomonadaceae bacterium]
TAAAEPARRAADAVTPDTPPDTACRALSLAGYVAARTGRAQQARDLLTRAANYGGNDVWLSMGTGILAQRSGGIEQAVSSFTDATRLDPRRAECWRRLGDALRAAVEPDLAVDAYRRAASLSDRDPRLRSRLAEALVEAGRHADAVAEFRAAAALAPGDPQFAALPAVGLANAARTEAEYSEAVRQVTVAVAARPHQTRLRTILANLHMRFWRWPAARAQIEACVAEHPETASNWRNLAIVADRMGDPAAARLASARFDRLVDLRIEGVHQQERILEVGPNVPALARLAAVFRQLGKTREAVRALEQAASLAPDDAAVQQGLAEARAADAAGAADAIPGEGPDQP